MQEAAGVNILIPHKSLESCPIHFAWALHIVHSYQVFRTWEWTQHWLPRSQLDLWVEVFFPTQYTLRHLTLSSSRAFGSTVLAAPSSSLVWLPAVSLSVPKEARVTTRHHGRRGRGRGWGNIKGSLWAQGENMEALACFLLFQILTETRIVLKKMQKLQALLQVVAAVAAVTPRGHTEAAGVYVVGGHDCAWKRRRQGSCPPVLT